MIDIYTALQDPNLFLETYTAIPNTTQIVNSPSKTNCNYLQTKQKISTINTIHNNTHTIISNGRQVGITTLVSLYIIYYCLTNTKKTILIYNKNINAYHHILLHTLNNLNFVHSYNFNYTSTTKSKIEVNSNKIIIANNVNDIKGYGISLAYLDDFAFCENDVDIITNILPTISFTQGKIIISSTPSNHDSLFNKIYLQSNHFKKIQFPNNTNNFKNMMTNMLDIEEYEMMVDAKVFPLTPFQNNIKKKP